MSADEPSDLYRILHVQPDAPPEVIKAAWRALMSGRRVHPDLGGEHEAAVRLNTAYEVLSDPARRAAYDRSRQAARRNGATATARTGHAPAPDNGYGGAASACPFCGRHHAGPMQRGSRCDGCGSPLTPLPVATRKQEGGSADAHGRRQDPRFARDATVRLHLPGEPQPLHARLRDLSFTGLQLLAAVPLPRGSVARVVAPRFDALFSVVGCRSQPGGYALHGRLLTLAMDEQARGVYVDAKA